MRTRKINVTKAATPAKAKAAKPVKAVAETPVINVSAIVAASTTDKLQSEAKQKALFAKHDITHAYAGASAPFTSRKSRTPINAAYNRLAGEPITERDAAFLNGLKAKYNGDTFPRLNADAGNLRRAIERGYINYGTEANTFALTELALTSRLA